MNELDTDRVECADSLEYLGELPAESVHAVVTDPPYGLAFMGRSWDDFEPKEYQEWCEEWASLALDVLKPGGHLLAFSGNRTHHRLFTGVEDAGFEIRDTVTWHYGSGFPKALDVSKAIMKSGGVSRREAATLLRDAREAEGMTRDEVADAVDVSKASVRDWEEGRRRSADDESVEWVFPQRERHKRLAELFDPYPAPAETTAADAGADRRDDGTVIGLGHSGEQTEYKEVADAAKRWDGWKTALKPATEYVVVARKPLPGTVAECMQAHGTGALNIDGCRVGTEERENAPPGKNDVYQQAEGGHGTVEGRYPANVVFDETEAERLDRDVGECYSASGEYGTEGGEKAFWGSGDSKEYDGHDAHGGPSRYFYTSKASRAERTADGKIENAHPTVKPTDLMEWLVKLVSAEGQVVLDPFAGSGTTLVAAKNLNRRFFGIEKQAKWADVARVRAGLTPEDPRAVRDDDGQAGLEAFTDGGSFQK